ncbi:MAG: 4Fe-4S binding protein [Candidatus Omnitrophica bacterium]|nr:4Fe-4S binding protein [Candidatus Omnitrophota bacterium]
MAIFLYIKKFFISVYSIFLGFRVTLKNMFKKSVTLDYPLVKQPMKERFRGMVDLIPPDCVICYQCIRVCPTAALELAHVTKEDKKKEITKFVFNAEFCCFCGLCEEICPTDAIYLNKMYEVVYFDHQDMLSIDLMKADKYKFLNEKNPSCKI